MNILKEMALSVYSYKSYKEFLNNRKSKVFAFGIVLMLFYFLLTMGLPFAKSMVEIGGIGNFLEESVPDFELKDGYLWVEDVIEYEDYDTYIYIDSDPELVFYNADEMEEYLDDYSQVLLMDSEKMILKDDGKVLEEYYTDLDIECDRADLMGFVPFIYLIIAIVMLFACIWMTALFFFGVLFVALIGMIVASCMKYELTFGQLYLLGIYSRTLPLLIKAIVSYLPFGIPFFFIINFGISVGILAAAIRKMKEVPKPLEFHSDDSFNAGGFHDGNFSNGSMNGSSNNNKNDFSWMQ